jgi:hypothetical protein
MCRQTDPAQYKLHYDNKYWHTGMIASMEHAEMGSITHWFSLRWRRPAAMRSQQAVAARAAQVVEQVIFDMGAARLAQGTVRLDPGFRPRFNSSALAPERRALASVRLDALPEAAPLYAFDDDPAALEPHTQALVAALLREFRAQSPRFRALRERA